MNFSWTRLADGNIRIHIKTPVVEIGTLYRLTAAIFTMGLDIVSGDIKTFIKDGESYSDDEFILRQSDQSISEGEISAKLGIMMEAILRDHTDPDEFMKVENIQPPRKLEFFDVEPVIVFQSDDKTNTTQFHIEAPNRTGLLFHLTRILARENIDIIKAAIRTEGDYLAQDTFFLQCNGRKLEKETAERLEREIASYE